MEDGFTISVNTTCKTAQYNFLPSDYSGLFIYATDLESNPNAISNPIADLDAACNFDSKSEIFN